MKSDFEQIVMERLDRLEAELAALTEQRSALREKYPWHELKAKGDRFRHECDWREASRIRASIAANAIKRFGKGVVSTKIVTGGVLVIRRK